MTPGKFYVIRQTKNRNGTITTKLVGMPKSTKEDVLRLLEFSLGDGGAKGCEHEYFAIEVLAQGTT